MKTRILPPRQVLAQVDQVLARKLSPHNVVQRKPLVEVVEALYQGRGYRWVGVHLAAGSVSAPQGARESDSQRGSKHSVVPIKIANRTLGALEVESDSENALASPDRVLLKQVASRLARYLTSRGKVLLRREREKQDNILLIGPEQRGYQPVSQKAESQRAAAGGIRRT